MNEIRSRYHLFNKVWKQISLFYRFWKILYKALVYLFSPISVFFSRMFLKIREKPANTKGAVLILRKMRK